MKLVIIESPCKGDRVLNEAYARKCMMDSFERGELPYVSHLTLTQIMDDDDPTQRAMAMGRVFSCMHKFDKSVVYRDRGITEGMRQGIAEAERCGIPVEYRTIGECDLLPVDMGIPSEILSPAELARRETIQRDNPISRVFRKLLTWLHIRCRPCGSR